MAGLGFWVEPWWELGDDRWLYFALGGFVIVVLTYILPVGWMKRIHPSLDIRWEILSLRMRVIGHAKGSLERADAEEDLGWEEAGSDDPRIEARYEDQFRREIDLPPRDRSDD